MSQLGINTVTLSPLTSDKFNIFELLLPAKGGVTFMVQSGITIHFQYTSIFLFSLSLKFPSLEFHKKKTNKMSVYRHLKPYFLNQHITVP